MRLPEDAGFPVAPKPARPARDLLLAQALDACIAAERRLPGSSQEIIARQPAWARADLYRLLGLAGSLDAAASNAIMTSEFRVAARARLMQRIGGDTAPIFRPDERARRTTIPPPDERPLDLFAMRETASFSARKTFWARLQAWLGQFWPSFCR